MMECCQNVFLDILHLFLQKGYKRIQVHITYNVTSRLLNYENIDLSKFVTYIILYI